MNMVPKWLKSPLAISLLISFTGCLFIILLRNRGHLQFLELAAYDAYLQLATPVLPPDPRIILITITEEDINRLGQWPLTDACLARVLEILIGCGARVIGADIYRDLPVPPGGEGLSLLFSRHPNIVMVKKMGDEGSPGIPGPYMLGHADMVGFNDILVDPGGTVRRGLLFLDDGVQVSASFSLLIATLYLQGDGIYPRPSDKDSRHLRLGKTSFVPFESNDGGYRGADARGYQFLLDFHCARSPLKSRSISALLDGRIDASEIRDRIGIIGVTAESMHDYFYTPFCGGGNPAGRMSGVELHAHMVSQLLRAALEGDRPLQSLRDWYEGAWILIWGLLGGVLALLRFSLPRFSLLVVCGLILILSLTLFFFHAGWWIPAVPPAFGLFLSAASVNAFCSHREKMQKEALMQLFSRHVSDKVAQALWEQRDQFMEDGRPRPSRLLTSVLFADLQGFTAIAERLAPESLILWLNEFMEAMAEAVMDHGGIVNKYTGDGIMALFGVTLPRTSDNEIAQDAQNAVRCALAMSRKLHKLNASWQLRDFPSTGMRIGIFTGPLIAGSLGSSQRMEYTVIGDTVNIASRLEGFQKDSADPRPVAHGCRILIGEKTQALLGDRFETLFVGSVTLKGKGEPVRIYRVLDTQEPIPQEELS